MTTAVPRMRKPCTTGEVGVAPDHQSLTVDGEVFEVRYDVDQPGAYHFTWLNGPHPGYGFTTRAGLHRRQPQRVLIDMIRGFLEQIDPRTGYLDED